MKARVGLVGLACAAILVLAGCVARLPLADPKTLTRIPADAGLVFGRASVTVGWLPSRKGPVEVELIESTTQRRFAFTSLDTGEYFVLLPPGSYAVRHIKSGFYGMKSKTREGMARFTLQPGSVVYLGSVRIMARGSSGVMEVEDDYEGAVTSLTAQYPLLVVDPPPTTPWRR